MLELPFSSARIFLDSHKVFGFFIILLDKIGKQVIFSKFSDFGLQYLF